MKHLLKIKRKKSPEPPQQSVSGRPADNAAGPPTFHAELDGVLNREGGGTGPRIMFQDAMGVDQNLPASGASTSGFAIVDTGYENRRTAENTKDIGRETGHTETLRTAKGARKGTLLEGVGGNAEKFGPLKIALGGIPALYANREKTIAVNSRIENLLSRVVSLEERLNSRPSDVADLRCRDELRHKLDLVGGQLRLLAEKPGLPQLTDHVQDNDDLFRPLDDLQEAILDYQMAQQKAIRNRELGQIDPAEADVLNNVRYAKQAEYRHTERSGCLKGTRTAILDQIELWIHDFDEDKPTIYWLNGLAGTGKTTIAQTTAERAFADGRLGASFFCSRDFQDRRDLRMIFPTLAVQLSRRYPEFRSAFVKLVRSDPDIVHEPLYNQMEKLIVQPLAESTISTVIVIDALDECEDEEPACAILSVLGQFVADIPMVKFFITGRPESRIQEGFRLPLLAEATDVFVLHEVEPSQVSNDIQLFFRHSFSELKRNRRGLDDWPTEEQVDILCERAGGLFVYAMATVRFIGERNNSPKMQLDRLLQSQESSVFEGRTRLKANATLDLLYASILQEAFGVDHPENDPRVRSVLGAVVLAANPLSPSAIAALLGFESEEVLPLLLSLHSLLVLREDTNLPVRPFHKSFPDFIVDPARCTNPRFRVFPPDHHTELLSGCLETMNQELERNMCKLPDGVTNSEVIDLKERAEEHIGQTLEYACKSWHKHLVGTVPAHITLVLHRFLEEKFLFWLEALSILGAARVAVEALGVIEKCKWRGAQPTLDLVRDCSRFVSVFFEVISTSAPHIYHSALSLSPLTSTIRGLYQQYASPLARIVRGVPLSWEPVVATIYLHHRLQKSAVAWSPCSKFIAVAAQKSVEVLDAATLNRLATFEHPLPSEGSYPGFSPDSRSLTLLHEDGGVFSWDLQTGGCLSEIREKSPRDLVQSFAHSKDGKMVAVANMPMDWTVYRVCTFDLPSRTRLGPLLPPGGRLIAPIWTHNKSLRFATINREMITIQEVEFTLIHPPTQVEFFPIPDEVAGGRNFLLFPALSRLAFTLKDTIQVWDAKASKLLLSTSGAKDIFGHLSVYSFSSDSHFFAILTAAGEVHVWKESPAGYVLHRQFPSLLSDLKWLHLSPNGGSIVFPLDDTINLWHTGDQIPSPPTTPTKERSQQHFILTFSLNQKSAAFTQPGGNVVTILDLKSGNLRLTIDTGMRVQCLGVPGDTVIVADAEKIVTWNLPNGDRAFNADVYDSVRTVAFHPRVPPYSTQILSPDHSFIVAEEESERKYSYPLEIYDVPTGMCLASIPSPGLSPSVWFTRDGREAWKFGDVENVGWGVIKDDKSGGMELKPLEQSYPSGTLPWESPQGYEVTDDGWVLSPTRERLLWLPHRWRSDKEHRIWNGRFLGLSHRLSEVVILEFLELPVDSPLLSL